MDLTRYEYYLGDYKFLPRKELLAFANDFSQKYKNNDVNDYFSSNKKYQIHYFNEESDKEFFDNGYTANIGHIKGIISFSKPFLLNDKITSDFVYFLIIWLVIQKETKETVFTDVITCEWIHSMEFSKENIIAGFEVIQKHTPSSLNNFRLQLISSILNNKLDESGKKISRDMILVYFDKTEEQSNLMTKVDEGNRIWKKSDSKLDSDFTDEFTEK